MTWTGIGVCSANRRKSFNAFLPARQGLSGRTFLLWMKTMVVIRFRPVAITSCKQDKLRTKKIHAARITIADINDAVRARFKGLTHNQFFFKAQFSFCTFNCAYYYNSHYPNLIIVTTSHIYFQSIMNTVVFWIYNHGQLRFAPYPLHTYYLRFA